MKLDYLNCKRCGLKVRRKRLAQVYCGPECSDAAKKARKRRRLAHRSGDEISPATTAGSPSSCRRQHDTVGATAEERLHLLKRGDGTLISLKGSPVQIQTFDGVIFRRL